MTAGEAVVLRDGSWAATLVPVHFLALVRAQCMKPSRLATLFAHLLACCIIWLHSRLDTHECSSGKSCG